MVVKPQSVVHYIRHHFNQTLYNTAYFIALSAIVPAVAGYLFWGFSARLSTVEQVGIASALLSASAFLVLLSGLDLGTMLIRYLPTASQPARLINTIIVLRTVLSTLASLIFVAGIRLWSPAQSFLLDSPLLIIAFVMTNVIQSINELLVHVFVVLRKPHLAMFKNIFVAFIRFPLVLLAALCFGQIDGTGLYLTLMGGVFLILCLVFLKLLPDASPGYRLRVEFDGTQVRQLFRFSALNYIGELALQIPLLLAPVIIVNQLGNEESGVVYIVLMIASMVVIIPQGLARSLLSEGAHRPEEIRSNLRRVLGLSLLLEALMIVTLLIFGHLLLRLTLGSAQADQGIGFLILAVFSALPMTFILSYYSLQRLRGRIGAVAVVGGLVCLLSVVLISLLPASQGLTGVGIGLLIGQIAGAVITMPTLLMWVFGASPFSSTITHVAEETVNIVK